MLKKEVSHIALKCMLDIKWKKSEKDKKGKREKKEEKK